MALDAKARWNLVAAGAVGAVLGAWLGYDLTGQAFFAALAGVAGALLVACGQYAAHLAKTKRDAAFALVGSANGWTLQTDVDGGPGGLLSQFPPSRQGHTQTARRMLSGKSGWMEFHVMDAEYVTGAGKSRKTHRLAAVAFHVPVDLDMTIVRETGFHKVFDAFGGEDLDVEHDAFSRTFWVRSTDRKTAYAVLHPGTIEFLLAAGTQWTWAWQGRTVMMSRPGRLEPAECVALVAQAGRFHGLLPRHLVAEHTPRAPPGRMPPPA